MSRTKSDGGPVFEADPRFVTGEWQGHYVQHGRPHQMRLYLEFLEGRFQGAGLDRVGMFQVIGTYDIANGKVKFAKQYPSHHVDYEGWAEVPGEGVWGRWQISHTIDHGGFRIWPCRFDEDEEGREHESKPVAEWDQPIIP